MGESSPLYAVEFSPAAAREFEKLTRQLQLRLKPRIDQLAQTPRPHGCTKLSGTDNQYRIRVGRHRIVYAIEDDRLLILVLRVRKRDKAYE